MLVAIVQDFLKHCVLLHASKLNRREVFKSGLIFGDSAEWYLPQAKLIFELKHKFVFTFKTGLNFDAIQNCTPIPQ